MYIIYEIFRTQGCGRDGAVLLDTLANAEIADTRCIRPQIGVLGKSHDADVEQLTVFEMPIDPADGIDGLSVQADAIVVDAERAVLGTIQDVERQALAVDDGGRRLVGIETKTVTDHLRLYEAHVVGHRRQIHFVNRRALTSVGVIAVRILGRRFADEHTDADLRFAALARVPGFRHRNVRRQAPTAAAGQGFMPGQPGFGNPVAVRRHLGAITRHLHKDRLMRQPATAAHKVCGQIAAKIVGRYRPGVR